VLPEMTICMIRPVAITPGAVKGLKQPNGCGFCEAK